MIIGVPKEIKNREHRVGLVPGGVKALVKDGHKVLVEKSAGLGSGITDAEYKDAGASLVDKKRLFAQADMVIKVKEPLEQEYRFFRKGQILYTYLHLAAAPKLLRAILKIGVKAVAYETIQLKDGSLPLLTPMSEVAGKMSVQLGSRFLEKHYGGRGVLLGGVPGVPRSSPSSAAAWSHQRRQERHRHGGGGQHPGNRPGPPGLPRRHFRNLGEHLDGPRREHHQRGGGRGPAHRGAVLIPGAKAPKLVTEAMIKRMKPGSVVVDVAVDQGGCIETCEETSHDRPVIVKHGVLHYAVPNIPGAVSNTSTYALTNVTLKYARDIARLGLEEAVKRDEALRRGVNAYLGKLTCAAVAQGESDLKAVDLLTLL